MDNSRLENLLNFYATDNADGFIIFAIAKEYEKNGDLANAEKYYLELREKQANYTGLYYHLAKLYEEQGEIDKAMAVYVEGIRICKQEGDLHALSELNNAKLNMELEEGL